jgi:hypothetical protein
MAFGNRFKKKSGVKKDGTKYTSVGVGAYDKGDFYVGNIPLERFSEYATLFKAAKEKGVGLAVFVRENASKKGDKSPDLWVNLDFKKEFKKIEEDEDEDTTDTADEF